MGASRANSAGRPTGTTRNAQRFAVALAWLVAAAVSPAQDAPALHAFTGPTLRDAFEAAWSRQPEAQALAAHRDAVHAQQRSAQSWTPEPPAVELSARSDRLNRNRGLREDEIGVAIPLWLPGERSQARALADAQGRALESRTMAARLRVAAAVREAWWTWQRAVAEAESTRSQLDSVRRLAADVDRRLKAGDLARSDQHQAASAVAAAESARAEAEATAIAARQRLFALTGLTAQHSLAAEPGAIRLEAEADPAQSTPAPADTEPAAELVALRDRAAVAERVAALEDTRSRANPELTLATTRDRSVFGEAYQRTFTLGLRIPLGAGPRHDARAATARAEVIELQAQGALELARLAGERESARARAAAARVQLVAADRRALLARESRGFFDKSYRLGETDLPTRLRIEADAADAERHAARARIELAAAISAWRQALGLLPQ